MPIGSTDDNMADAPAFGGITKQDVAEVASLTEQFNKLGDDLEAQMATADGRVAAMTSTVALIGKAANMLVGLYQQHSAAHQQSVPSVASPKSAVTGALSALLAGNSPESVVRGLLSQFVT